jgi:hypothetical protein
MLSKFKQSPTKLIKVRLTDLANKKTSKHITHNSIFSTTISVNTILRSHSAPLLDLQ